MALHIYQDRAEFLSTTEGKIVYSKLRDVFYGQRWKCHDASENRCPARLYPQAIRDTDTKSFVIYANDSPIRCSPIRTLYRRLLWTNCRYSGRGQLFCFI
jgi:hypothetical protein